MGLYPLGPRAHHGLWYHEAGGADQGLSEQRSTNATRGQGQVDLQVPSYRVVSGKDDPQGVAW